MNKTAPR
jgi:hypothetical protein